MKKKKKKRKLIIHTDHYIYMYIQNLEHNGAESVKSKFEFFLLIYGLERKANLKKKKKSNLHL